MIKILDNNHDDILIGINKNSPSPKDSLIDNKREFDDDIYKIIINNDNNQLLFLKEFENNDNQYIYEFNSILTMELLKHHLEKWDESSNNVLILNGLIHIYHKSDLQYLYNHLVLCIGNVKKKYLLHLNYSTQENSSIYNINSYAILEEEEYNKLMDNLDTPIDGGLDETIVYEVFDEESTINDYVDLCSINIISPYELNVLKKFEVCNGREDTYLDLVFEIIDNNN